MSDIKVVDFEHANASQQFTAGLKEIGFAVIANHPVNQTRLNEIYKSWEAFFKLSPQEKAQYNFNSETHDGYVPLELSETAKGFEIRDIKEFYHFYPWGRCPEHLRPLTMEVFDALNKLAVTLLQWIEQHAPKDVQTKLSMPLSEMIKDSTHTMFRLIHYPPLTGKEPPGAVRAAEHGDINLLTILPAATAEGLQVRDKNGQWLDVPINPDWIIVNIGDMLQECTGHYYPSTLHRVMNPVGEAAKQSRLSMPLFFHPVDEVVLSERHTAKSYRRERFEELGLVETAE